MAMRDPDYAVGWALDATSGETAGTDPIADAVIGAVAGGRASALRAAAISLLCWRCWASKSSSSKLLAKHESQHPPRCGPSWPRPQVVKKHICWRVAIIVEQHAPQQMARQLPWSSLMVQEGKWWQESNPDRPASYARTCTTLALLSGICGVHKMIGANLHRNDACPNLVMQHDGSHTSER